MKIALNEAKKAFIKDEIPVGAVLVHNGKIISRGHNEKESKQDPTKHAEITAIKKAARKLSSWRLNDCELYVTLEPCPMCAGAIIQSRIKKVFIGTPDPKSGAVGSILNLFEYNNFNHKVEYEYGILTLDCSNILKEFFKKLRTEKSKLKTPKK
jgi:tRNA(adenine34) deaminase